MDELFVFGFFFNAVKILSGKKRVFSPAVYEALWVRDTFIQKLLFGTFPGLSAG